LPSSDEPPDETTRTLALVSLFFPLYYLIASWAISVRIALRAARLARLQASHGERGS
jgi:hypothetical protein